ncbi:hypothetical protein L083_0353 [Actinoplanes sp. N902-109]|nr:hypothetical protein L083_0353 [Actinoplanes sp. N902-109]
MEASMRRLVDHLVDARAGIFWGSAGAVVLWLVTYPYLR